MTIHLQFRYMAWKETKGNFGLGRFRLYYAQCFYAITQKEFKQCQLITLGAFKSTKTAM